MKNDFEKLFSSYKFWLTLICLAVVVLLAPIASRFIGNYFPNRAILDDLFFQLAPYISWTQILTDVAVFFALVGLLIYILRNSVKKFPYYLAVFALMEFFRDVLIVLTPIGRPTGNLSGYGMFNIHQNGMFPSGHIAICFLVILLVKYRQEPLLKTLTIIFFVIETITLILSRGHYSIDIVGGVMIAYISFMLIKKYQKKLEVK